MILLKCHTQYVNKFEKFSNGYKTGKAQFSFHTKQRQCQKCSSYCTIALILHTGKIMLKILQARFQQYMNCELPDIQTGFRKGRGTIYQISNICWIIEKAREFQKKSTSPLLITPKRLIVWITTNYGKFLKRWEYQTT